MTEDQNTEDYSDREFLELMRRELSIRLERMGGDIHDIQFRVGELERRTNPLPPNYDQRFAALEADVKEIRRDMRSLRKHDWEREKELEDVRERVELLEAKAA